MAKPLYDTLGVGEAATDAEIAKAYRKLAKQCHPDLKPGDKAAEERFKRISAAYDILGDKDKRARYNRGEIDEEGRERAFSGGFGAGGFPGGGFGRRAAGGDGSTQFEFRTGPGGVGIDDILSELFGGRRGANARQGFARPDPPGEDLRFTLDIDFLEAAKGSVKRVSLPDGSTLDVTIPPGIESGAVLRLRGKGRAAAGGGEPGDALVTIGVSEHQRLKRQGFDILSDEPVALDLAVRGGKLRVATIDGEVSVTVPKHSSSGRVLRLRGKGIKDTKSGRQGDHLVRLMIQMPQHDAELDAWAEKRATISA
jgi:DnaJ-class molecular chaperone